jgi:hypothetical protein
MTESFIRFGKKWDEKEICDLLKELHKGLNYPEIAKKHERSVGGIRTRLWTLAGDYYEEGKTIPEIHTILKLLPTEDIESAIESRKYKLSVMKNKEAEKEAKNNSGDSDGFEYVGPEKTKKHPQTQIQLLQQLLVAQQKTNELLADLITSLRPA